MKTHDEVKKLVLRSLLSAVNYYKIEVQKELTDEDTLNVIKREVKKHRESIEMFQKGGRQDLVRQEQKELEILLSYLPRQMSEEEIEKIIKAEVEKLKTNGMILNSGLVMKTVMSILKGKAEGAVVKKIVDKLLR